ncbi:MAG: hypothetical protein Q4D96_02875 [Propionibacteriaceae bacterium]|nr:hypothetical protein [Propionibacteriaceae bacterium]
MAVEVQYGAWAPNGSANKRMRLRLVWSVSESGSSATVGLAVYVEAGYSFYDWTNSFSVSGGMGSRSGTVNVRVSTGGSQLLWQASRTVALTGSAQTISAAASLSGIDYLGTGVTASVSGSVTLPARAVAAPGAPARVWIIPAEDRRHDVKWQTVPGASTYTVERWSRSSGVWSRIGVGVVGDTFHDRGTTFNDAYQWRVSADNAAGGSAATLSPVVYTSPSAPVVSVRREGAEVILSLSPGASRTTQFFDITGQADGGGWVQLVTRLSATNSEWRHTPDPGKTVRYQVRAVSLTPSDLLRVSGWVMTPHVALPAPPAAPLLLGPLGTIATGQPSVLHWRHNPVDASAQTGHEVRYRAVGTDAWTTRTGGTGDTHTVTLPPGRWEWQARTKGVHADFGPWSAVSGWLVANPPTVRITSPRGGQTLTSNRLRARWEFTDPEGGTSAGWELQLTGPDGTHTYSGGANNLEHTPAQILVDGGSYTLQVRGRAANGLWSPWATARFAVDYLEPPVPRITARWVEEAGQVILEVDGRGASSLPAAEQIRIEVSSDDGATWQEVGSVTGTHGTTTHHLPMLGGVVAYRAIAISALPSEATSQVVRVGTPTTRAWLNADDGAAVHLILDMGVQEQRSHEVELVTYLGSASPTPHFGRARGLTVGFSGTVTPRHGSPKPEWERLLGQRLWWRDPTGRIVRGVLSSNGIDIQEHRGRSGRWSISGQVVRVDG